jgi:mRNA-degrading endonuclease RelE of RelBE toxin-antitoxin system
MSPVALIIPPPVMKQLAGLPRSDAGRLLERLQRIAGAPDEPHPNVIPLAGESGSYRLCQGPWRAVFSIEDGDVILDRVAHRREVYR